MDNITLEKSKQTSFAKLGRVEWNKVERKYNNPHTLTVLGEICKLGDPTYKSFEADNKFVACGDTIYNKLIRPALVKLDCLPKLPKKTKSEISNNKPKSKISNKKHNKKKGLTAKEIREKNINDKVKNVLKNTVRAINNTDELNTIGFKAQYIEIRLLTFMYCVQYYMTKKVSYGQMYELIIGITKTLSNIKNIKNLSKTAYEDTIQCCEKLEIYVTFTYKTVFERYPKLVLSTCYDNIFPTMSIKPYDSQINLMNALKRHKKCLCLYSAMIGSGKTTLSVAIVKFVEKLRVLKKAKNNKSQNPIQVLFSCSVEPVRHQVSRMAYNMEIPFGIAIIQNGVVKVTNNYNCKKDINRLLIIADLNSTIELLKQQQNYILFLDEPTVGADQPNHPITRSVAKVMLISPTRTILSSATLPSEKEIIPIVDYFKKRHKDAHIINICSKEAIIGCEMITYSGETITPHNNCTSNTDVAYIIDRIKKTSFIDRLYTAPVVYRLVERMESAGLDVINLEEHFSDITKLSQNEIQKIAVQLLGYLLENGTDDQVKKVCKPLIVSDNSKYDINNIFTTDAHKFLGSCLVTVEDPIKFTYERSKQLLDGLDFNRIMKKYLKELNDYDNKHNKLKNIKDEDEKSKKVQELSENSRPTLNIPGYIKVNTQDHIKMYCKDIGVDKKSFQQVLRADIPLDFNITDWMYLMLFAGVGIYTPTDTSLDKRYTDLVLNLASEGKLSFLISDDNISYGANYPFSHVVITDEVVDNHSLLTIFQLAGRAGRVGTSWVAWAHVSDKTGQRVVDYIKTNEDITSAEATNLINIFDEVSKLVVKK